MNGWYASKMSPDDEGYNESAPWEICLQLDGWSPTLTVWFSTEADAVAFLKTEVLGKELL